MKRHCLRIPFLIGQRDDAVIGHACADNPVWGVGCEPGDIPSHVCISDTLLEDLAEALTLPAQSEGVESLTEPPIKVVTFA